LEIDYRLSVPPDLPRKDKDLPGYWAILFVRAVVQHFAGTRLLLARSVIRSSTEKPTSSSRKNRTLDIRNDYSFRSHLPTAHTFACLRFADRVTETVARLTTGSGGLTPGRAGFAPAG